MQIAVSTAQPQSHNDTAEQLLGDKAPSIFVADPSGLVSGYFLNGRQTELFVSYTGFRLANFSSGACI